VIEATRTSASSRNQSDVLEVVSVGQAFEDLGIHVAGLFHTRAWLAVLEETFGYSIVMVVDPQRRVGVPVAILDDVVGKRMVSLPFSDFVETDLSFLAIRKALAVRYPDHLFVMRALGERGDEGGKTGEAFHHRVVLANDNVMWSAMSSSFRRGVRKAENAGVTVRRGTDRACVDRFFEIYALHRQKKFGILSQPRYFFHKIHERFFETGLGYVLEAEVNGMLAASILCLLFGEGTYYKFGASALDLLGARPNNLLFWKLLIEARNSGCEFVDLGLCWQSDGHANLRRFKESLGGQAMPITLFRYAPNNFDHKAEERARDLLRDMTSLVISQAQGPDALDRAARLLFSHFT
jgi:hypothetical protein